VPEIPPLTAPACVCVAGVDCGLPSSAGSLVDLLDAEYQLFKLVVSGSTRSSSLSRDRLLDEFCRLQQRHATLVNSLLRSHANLQQVYNIHVHYTGTCLWKCVILIARDSNRIARKVVGSSPLAAGCRVATIHPLGVGK